MGDHAETVLEQFTAQPTGFAAAAPIRDRALLRLIVAASGATADDRVLDVACGPGIVTCAFARVARHAVGLVESGA